jgi:hypothetical protein
MWLRGLIGKKQARGVGGKESFESQPSGRRQIGRHRLRWLRGIEPTVWPLPQRGEEVCV